MYKKCCQILLFTGFSTLFCSCAVLKATSGKNTAGTSEAYSEDLSSLRPQDPVIIKDTVYSQETAPDQVPQNNEVVSVHNTLVQKLDSISSFHLEENKYSGFTVLVHTGSKREEALEMLGNLKDQFPDVKTEVVYQQPYFKVRMGRFQKQIQANSLLNEIKEMYPAAIVVPDTFPIVEDDQEDDE